jgi:hypothetical protein
MSGGGLMGDASEIRFVYGQDSLEKCERRIVLLRQAVGLPFSTRIDLIGVLYGLTKEEIKSEMENYILTKMPQLSAHPIEKQFAVWWEAIIAREKHDLLRARKRLKGMGV